MSSMDCTHLPPADRNFRAQLRPSSGKIWLMRANNTQPLRARIPGSMELGPLGLMTITWWPRSWAMVTRGRDHGASRTASLRLGGGISDGLCGCVGVFLVVPLAEVRHGHLHEVVLAPGYLVLEDDSTPMVVA